VALFLWFTVLFANFAEAVAEGRGKAQADTLRKTRSETTARRRSADGTIETVSSAIRVSAGLATTEEHVERLLTAVAQLAAEGPGTAYTHVAGHGWEPADDPRDLTIPRLW